MRAGLRQTRRLIRRGGYDDAQTRRLPAGRPADYIICFTAGLQARSNRLNKHVKLLLVHITGPALTLYSAVAITVTQDGRAFAASPDNRPSVPAGRSGQHNSCVTS